MKDAFNSREANLSLSRCRFPCALLIKQRRQVLRARPEGACFSTPTSESLESPCLKQSGRGHSCDTNTRMRGTKIRPSRNDRSGFYVTQNAELLRDSREIPQASISQRVCSKTWLAFLRNRTHIESLFSSCKIRHIFQATVRWQF